MLNHQSFRKGDKIEKALAQDREGEKQREREKAVLTFSIDQKSKMHDVYATNKHNF